MKKREGRSCENIPAQRAKAAACYMIDRIAASTSGSSEWTKVSFFTVHEAAEEVSPIMAATARSVSDSSVMPCRQSRFELGASS